MAHLYTGTSGFAYPSWKPDFYPAKLPPAKFLEHYATRLNCVEVNYTFRRLPSRAVLENWVNSTPAHFVFALKAPMRITHILKLKDAAEATELFLRVIDPLRSARRIGPVLYQLPPTLKCDLDCLRNYLALLPRDFRFAFEFRHASWHAEPVYDLLRQHNVSLCVAESDKLETPEVVTADFVYYRLRKAEYTPQQRDEIEVRARAVLAANLDLYLFFKHEDEPQGALYAEDLLARF